MFAGGMTHPESWVTFIFVVLSLMVFANGGSYSAAPMVGGLSLIFLAPLAVLQAVAGLGGLSAVLLPFAVIAFFAYVLTLNEVFGEALWVLAVFAGIIVMLGA